MGLQQTIGDGEDSISRKVAKSSQFVYDISEIMDNKDKRETRWLGKCGCWQNGIPIIHHTKILDHQI